jgi:hypothetical protein
MPGKTGQISPAAAVRVVRDDGTRPRRHPLLRERGKIAKMHARSGVIRGIQVETAPIAFCDYFVKNCLASPS